MAHTWDLCSSRGPEFNSQPPHGGSQLSVVGSDALLLHKVGRANKLLVYILQEGVTCLGRNSTAVVTTRLVNLYALWEASVPSAALYLLSHESVDNENGLAESPKYGNIVCV